MRFFHFSFLLLILLFLLSCYVFSELSLLLLLVNLTLLLLVGVYRIALLIKYPVKKSSEASLIDELKISIHLQVNEEPIKVVYNAIRSICNQNYSNFELIILLNKSATPLKCTLIKFCQKYNQSIRVFSSYEKNSENFHRVICNSIVSKDAQYILTLKARYVLQPNALSTALKQIKEYSTHAVQFPIGYFNEAPYNLGIKEELEHYYHYYSDNIDSSLNFMPADSIIILKKEVFEATNYQYSTDISEVTRLEILFRENNYKIYHSPSVVGWEIIPEGLLNLNFYQKKWISAKLNIVRKLWKSKVLPLQVKLISTIRLTVWLNFTALPIIAFLSSIFLPLHPEEIQPVIAMSIASFYLHFIIQFVLFGISTKFNVIKQTKGFLANTNTILQGAFYWFYNFILSKKETTAGVSFQHSRVYQISIYLFLALLLCCCTLQFIYTPSLAFPSFILFVIVTTSHINSNREFRNVRENLTNSIYPIS